MFLSTSVRKPISTTAARTASIEISEVFLSTSVRKPLSALIARVISAEIAPVTYAVVATFVLLSAGPIVLAVKVEVFNTAPVASTVPENVELANLAYTSFPSTNNFLPAAKLIFSEEFHALPINSFLFNSHINFLSVVPFSVIPPPSANVSDALVV